jgi:hypothetical protein
MFWGLPHGAAHVSSLTGCQLPGHVEPDDSDAARGLRARGALAEPVVP